MRLSGITFGFALTLAIFVRLEKQEAGVYFTAFAIIMFVTSIIRLGMDDILLKNAALYQSSMERKLKAHQSFLECLLLVFTVYGITRCLYIFLEEYVLRLFGEQLFLVIESLIWLPLLHSILSLLSIFFQGAGHANISIFGLTMLGQLISIIALFLFDGIQAETLGGIVTAATGFAVIFSAAFYVGLFGSQVLKGIPFQQAGIREGLIQYLPLWIVVISAQVFQWGVQITGSQFLEPESLADLALGVRLSQLAAVILVVVNYYSAPIFRRFYIAGELGKLMRMYKQITFYSFLIMAVITFGLIIFIPKLILIVGPAYASFQTFFYILWIGQAINVSIGPISHLYTMCNEEVELLRVSVLFCAVTVLAYFVVAESRSVLALPLVSAFSIGLYKIVLYVRFKKLISIKMKLSHQ